MRKYIPLQRLRKKDRHTSRPTILAGAGATKRRGGKPTNYIVHFG